MPWGTIQTQNLSGIDESNPQPGNTISLSPGELAHISVEKTDGGIISRLVVRVQARPDATSPWGFVHVPGVMGPAGIILRHDDDPVSFVVTGLFQFRIHLQGEDDTDVQTATVEHKLDGVNLSP